MKKLGAVNTIKVIDCLMERCAFERASVRVYDHILRTIQGSSDPNIRRMLADIQRHRDEEKQHGEWLDEQMRLLGGDARTETDRSRLATTEAKGLEEVVMSAKSLPPMFHALLAVELSDCAGWDLLVQLAEEADDNDAKRIFKNYLHEEQEHLRFVRQAVERFNLRDILGRDVRMPGTAGGVVLGGT